MARLFDYWNGDSAYFTLLGQLHDHGTEVSPRGQKTREFTDVTIVIHEPMQAAPVATRTGFNMRIAATELVQLLAGVSHLGQLDDASNGRFSRYANNGRLLGAYGPRLFWQLPKVHERLRADPDTRQAVVNLWRPGELETASNDVPCTLSLTFRIRAGMLDLAVHMRSNDVMMGVPYDWFVFSRVQRAMAESLNLPIGQYVHHVDSLHLYERDFERARQMYELAVSGQTKMTKNAPPFSPAYIKWNPDPDAAFSSWEDVQRAARQTIWWQVNNSWFTERIKPLTQDDVICETCRYVVPASDVEQGFLDGRGQAICTRCY